MLEAFGELQQGGRIDIAGTYSRMDFDLSTGESDTDYAILCLPAGAQTPIEAVESGLVYDAQSDGIRGTLSCARR